jgi:hypothetical protein
MLSPSCLFDNAASFKVNQSVCDASEENTLLRENIRLVQNEIKLLKQNSFLQERLLHCENVQSSKAKNTAQSNQQNITGFFSQSDQSISDTVNEI